MAERYNYHFESLTDFVTYVKAAKMRPEYGEGAGAAAGNPSWYGSESLAATYELAANGWPAGRAKLVDAFVAAKAQMSNQPDFTMDVAGAFPLVALAVAGDPCSMVDLLPIEERKRPIVRLAVNVSASCAYSAKELINYGAACLSYIDALEAHGFRVELTWLVHCALNGAEGRYNLNVIAKQAEEPMELDKLAFMFVNGSCFRRLMFQHCQADHKVTPLPPRAMYACGTASNPVPGIDTLEGQLLIPGINTFSPKSPALASPKAAAMALDPILDRLLGDAGLHPPRLAFAQDEYA